MRGMARVSDWLMRLVCAGGLLLCAAANGAPHLDASDTPRTQYIKATAALAKGDFDAFRNGLKATEGYILQPFLLYRFMRRRLAEFDPAAMRTFIERNQSAFVSEALRAEWLLHLGNNRKWQTFLDNYRGAGGDPNLLCFEARARTSRDGMTPATEALLERLWLSGASRPKSCDAVFAAWERHGGLTEERVWARIRLAVADNNLQLAGWLGRRYLSAPHQPGVQAWLTMHRNPAAALAGTLDPGHPHFGDLIGHGIRRLARADPALASARLARLRRLSVVDTDTEATLTKDIAITAAKHRTPNALQWLAALPPEQHDDQSRNLQAETALLKSDWTTLAEAIANMSAAAQEQPKWRYWHARALLQTGDSPAAHRLLSELAQLRHYYGFMAADRLERPYAMGDRPTSAAPALVAEISGLAGVRMARELRAVGAARWARRQWRWATRGFSDTQLRAASVLAHGDDWHDRAIEDAARSGNRADLTLRFPVAHRALVERYAKRYGVDSSLIFSVIRQESAFMVDAVSSAGALGLMQLMPGTGKRVARRLKRNITTRSGILHVENNIELGSHYLRQMLDRFGENPALAAAAYNAGPNRASKWIPSQRTPTDLWVEAIPFTETRNYVKNVLAFMMVYDYRLGRTARRMTNLMDSIPSAAALASK